jgi:hypothetical protein
MLSLNIVSLEENLQLDVHLFHVKWNNSNMFQIGCWFIL